MKINKFGTIILAIVALIFIGCAKNAEVSQANDSGEMQKTIEQKMTSALQISSGENGGQPKSGYLAPSSDIKSQVVGVWRAQHPLEGIPYSCVSEWIYQNNGAYSGATQCGPYASQRTGSWSLPDDSTIRVSLNDGQMVRWASWKFRMLDRNRMALGDGAIIAYRVN